ncbi:DUF4393 domain-containing protein [Euzebya sp.]|uniref:DUF4393 domain-containing protein n=1 Tax=Euzebya sp. TaxID=1971409 RepID=UPI00351505F0
MHDEPRPAPDAVIDLPARTPRTDPPPERPTLLSAGVGLARLTAGASIRLGRWGVTAGVRIGSRVVKAAMDGETATHLIDDAAEALRDQARDLLGIVDEAGKVVGFQMPEVNPDGRPELDEEAASTVSARALREKGAALLEASADVEYDEPFHPAYARILDELAPDEARILRLLATEGSQPAVDVRTASPFPGSSQLVAPGLNMIGAEAGLHFVDRVPAYLNNLERLGLVWFSREELRDPSVYQVLEAQPEVVEAMGRGRTKTIRRSIQITPFGQGFAQACLPFGAVPPA